MKIVVIGGYAKSLINFRGALLAELCNEGHEVFAIASEPDSEVQIKLSEIGVQYFAVPLERAGMNPFRDLAYFGRLLRILNLLKPDLILSYTIKPVIFGSLAAKLAGVSSINSMITGLGYAFSGVGIKRWVVSVLVRIMYKTALSINNCVLFQNPDNLNLFLNLNLVSPTKAVLINGSGVDIDFYDLAPISTKPVFIMIARLLRDKGIFEYVDAARLLKVRHPQTIFQLLGPLDCNPAAISQKDLDAWQAENVIEYLGYTDDVRPYIRRAAVYVLPSYSEGTPRTVLEAMAMGRPIVTTDAPGCRETVICGENGWLVPIKDHNALALVLERFIQNPTLIEAMGSRSRKIAEEKYDVHKVNKVIMNAMGLVDEKAA